MSRPLTLERFEVFEKTIFERLDDQDDILTAAKSTLDAVAEKVDAIEKLLWQGQRLDEIESRVIKLAETVGRPDLTTPFTRPLGI